MGGFARKREEIDENPGPITKKIWREFLKHSKENLRKIEDIWRKLYGTWKKLHIPI